MLKNRQKWTLLIATLLSSASLSVSGANAANRVVVIPLTSSATNSCTIIHQGICYGTVISQGRTWLDRNLGAARVATSPEDEDAYGSLYQWGRGADGHEYRTSHTISTLSTTDNPGHDNFIVSFTSPFDWRDGQKDNLWQGVSGINNPCPAGFRLPTKTEWEAEISSWSTNDATGAFASPLKLVMAGWRSNIGNSGDTGQQGRYWSSSPHNYSPVTYDYSYHLFFDNADATILELERASGFSVRCIKN